MKKVRDHYFKKAKSEGYPARSVYKLKEAQARYGFLKRGMRVLDIGACPGAWTKFASQSVGRSGHVVAVDLNPLSVSLPNCTFIKRDIFDLQPDELLPGGCPGFHAVLSDMAPKTTGRRDVDHLRQVALADRALDIATMVLYPGGALFCKVFQGEDFPQFRRRCSQVFKKVSVFKPKSSRSESVEIFLFCR